MDNAFDADKAITCAVGQRDSSGLDNIRELPSTDEEHQVDFPGSPTIVINNNSACITANDDLDMKLHASMTMDDVLLDDLSHTSTLLPHTTMNNIGVEGTLNV